MLRSRHKILGAYALAYLRGLWPGLELLRLGSLKGLLGAVLVGLGGNESFLGNNAGPFVDDQLLDVLFAALSLQVRLGYVQVLHIKVPELALDFAEALHLLELPLATNKGVLLNFWVVAEVLVVELFELDHFFVLAPHPHLLLEGLFLELLWR